MLRASQSYQNNDRCILIILVDLRSPDAVENLHHLRAVWQDDSDIEALDEDHFVLIVRPGGAQRLAA
jgi:hypothetical protein